MIGRKKGTWGELSRSIQIFLSLGVAAVRGAHWANAVRPYRFIGRPFDRLRVRVMYAGDTFGSGAFAWVTGSDSSLPWWEGLREGV